MTKEKHDSIKIIERHIEYSKEQREAAVKYCEQVASIMEELESEEGKKLLAEITQENYKQILELDIRIELLEKELEIAKII